MSDRIKIQRQKAATSTYTQPNLAQNASPGFGLPSSTSSQSHDISKISLRPQAKLTVSQPGNIYFGAGETPENNDLMPHELTHVVQQTDSVPLIQRQPDSDYVREILLGGKSEYRPAEAATYANNGSNDAVMTPKHNIVSDTFNSGINGLMGLAGYNTRARPATEDNDFYRDYAQYMPGYNIDGIPSGAWAQNAATNHVGHGTAPGNPWDNVRRSLVQQEKSMIDADLKGGGTGQLSFWDLYSAHENAYDTSGGGGNGFIDPASFGLAVYGAPALEAVGIDSGPITGASIDIFNNPEDSATEGWAKRMGLAGGEILAGGALTSFGLGSIASGNVVAGGAAVLGGLGMVGLGGFSAGWNTASAIDHGMLGEWGNAISKWGSGGSEPGDYPSPSPDDPVYA
jgi:hypothetical protein